MVLAVVTQVILGGHSSSCLSAASASCGGRAGLFDPWIVEEMFSSLPACRSSFGPKFTSARPGSVALHLWTASLKARCEPRSRFGLSLTISEGRSLPLSWALRRSLKRCGHLERAVRSCPLPHRYIICKICLDIALLSERDFCACSVSYQLLL